MNFSNLQYFVTVADELNVTKAAEKLYISQQSLSNQIIKLENELGVKLFVRNPGLKLTYAGDRLYKSARHILDLHNQMLSEIEDIKDNKKGKLRIGISHTRGRILLPYILPAFREKYPLVEVTLIEGNSEMLENHIRHGEVDISLSFTPRNQEGIESIELTTDRLLLVVHRRFMEQLFGNKTEDMRKKFLQSADITAFKDCPFLLLNKGNRIRMIIDSYLEKVGIHPNIVLETENTETAYTLALEGMGITVYPEMFMTKSRTYHGVDLFPLTSEDTMATIVVSYAKDRYLSKAAEDFIDIAISAWRDKNRPSFDELMQNI